jgi:Flp pilus assembly protein TadD
LAAMAVAVTFCVSGTPPAIAAQDSTSLSRDQIESRRQALLHSMLQDPSNLDVAFEYASLSSQVGDYEAAVSTLERMLIFAPNTPRLQLELGILYYRLGSYGGVAQLFRASGRQFKCPARNCRKGAALSATARHRG